MCAAALFWSACGHCLLSVRILYLMHKRVASRRLSLRLAFICSAADVGITAQIAESVCFSFLSPGCCEICTCLLTVQQPPPLSDCSKARFLLPLLFVSAMCVRACVAATYLSMQRRLLWCFCERCGGGCLCFVVVSPSFLKLVTSKRACVCKQLFSGE